LEDLGDYERAFEWLERATAAKRAASDTTAPRTRACSPLPAATVRSVPRLPRATRPRTDLRHRMPRTGTTLVDRILSSHPDVTRRELTDFALIVKRLTGTPSDRVLDTGRWLRAQRSISRHSARATSTARGPTQVARVASSTRCR
jgi:hypothetical protein